MPPGLVQETVDPTTGYKATPFCPVRTRGRFSARQTRPLSFAHFTMDRLQASATRSNMVPTTTDA